MNSETAWLIVAFATFPLALWIASKFLKDIPRDPASAEKSFRLVAGAFLAFLLMGSLTLLVRDESPFVQAVGLCAAHVGTGAFLLSMGLFLSSPNLDLIGLRKPKYLMEAGAGVLGYVLVLPAIFALHSLVLKWSPEAQKSQEALKAIVASVGSVEFYIRTITVVIAVPLFEELMVRGFLQRGLEGILASAGWRGARVLAVIIASLAFTALHDRQTWVSVMALSLLLGTAAARTGRLLIPIVAHGTHNLIVVVHEFLTRGNTAP